MIRNVDDEVVRSFDALAVRMGLSRNELLRRELGAVAHRTTRPVTREDLERPAEIFADLDNQEVMDKAWR